MALKTIPTDWSTFSSRMSVCYRLDAWIQTHKTFGIETETLIQDPEFLEIMDKSEPIYMFQCIVNGNNLVYHAPLSILTMISNETQKTLQNYFCQDISTHQDQNRNHWTLKKHYQNPDFLRSKGWM